MTKQSTLMLPNKVGPLDRDFEKLVKEALEVWHVPGVSIAVVDGESTWAKAYPSYDCFVLILTILLGLRYLLTTFHTCESINALLCWKYDESIYGSCHGISSRRQ